MNFKGTKGDWKFSTKTTSETDVTSSTHRICECKHYDSQIASLLEPTLEEGLANAQLIVDAGNTINKCDLLPSELLEQRDVLLEALIKIRKSIKNQKLESNFGHTLSYVDEAIENIQNNKNG